MTSRTGNAAWKRVVREVRRLGQETLLPCSLCRGALGPVDYRTRAEADREARETGQWWLIGAHRPLALSVDHIVPHAAGGPDAIENAAVSHAVCNSRAGAKGKKKSKPTAQPVVGSWVPLDDDNGNPLPGRAVPGQRTETHVFVANPTGGRSPGDPGGPPVPPPRRGTPEA